MNKSSLYVGLHSEVSTSYRTRVSGSEQELNATNAYEKQHLFLSFARKKYLEKL